MKLKCNKKPYQIFWAITNRCNLNCPYCFSDSGNKYKDLPIEIMQKITNLLICDRIYAITITGGEPLLRDDFEKIVNGFEPWQILSLNTNATLINKIKAKYIREKFHSVMVSLDGPEEIHDSIRGKGNFKKVINGICNLIEMGQKDKGVFINCTITNYNKDFIENTIKIALDLQVPRINFGECLYAGRNSKETYNQFSVKERVHIANKIQQLNKQYKNKINVTTDYFDSYLDKNMEEKSNVSVLSCGAGITSATILYTGQMVPCSLLGNECMTGDYVQDSSIKEIWNLSQNFYEWRKLKEITMQDICPSCSYNKLCIGGCRAEAFLSSGNMYAINPKNCLNVKKIWEYTKVSQLPDTK